MKIFPFVYLALFVKKGQFMRLAFGIAVMVLTTLISLWLVGPTLSIAQHGIAEGLQAWKNYYLFDVHVYEIGFDHSLYSGVKAIFAHHHIHAVLTVYMVASALTGIGCFFIWIRHLPLINQVMALTIAAILLPPMSGDYTLVHLYIPWAMLTLYSLGKASRSERVPGLAFCFACFAILLTPQSYFIVRLLTSTNTYAYLRFGGQIKALVLLALFIAALRYPFTEADDVRGTATAEGVNLSEQHAGVAASG